MLSRKEKDKYIVLKEFADCSVEIDRDTFDKAAEKLTVCLNKISQILSELRETDYEAFSLIADEVLYPHGASTSLAEYLSNELFCLRETLETHQDDIPIPKTTLEDIGFRKCWSGQFEKVIEDTEEREIVHEVLLPSKEFEIEKPVYRKRTILWEPTHYGRSSKEITYEELYIDDDLSEIIQNTLEKETTYEEMH